MRRAVLCYALLAVVTAGCASSSATLMPNGDPANHPRYPTIPPYATPVRPAATYAQAATPYLPPAQQPETTPYPDVQFPSVGINPYVDAASDPTSTFGLDVDTASYTVARTFIADGHRPDPASVRVEEWVNYFDQGYAPPETGAFAVHADGGVTPFLSQSEVLLRIGVKAREVAQRQRPSAALTFVVDVSGSMADGDRLELVKQSLRLLVDQLRSDDTVAIVAFTTDARVVLNPTRGSDRERILGAIAELRPLDSTNAEAGLRLGYQLASLQRIEGGINRVVLATDGVANVGRIDAASMLRDAGADSSSGIQLVAVGVGMGNYNDALLEQLADQGDGFYAYVDTLDEARRIFVDELISTIDTVALDAKAQVQFEPASVAGYRLIGYEDRGIPDNGFRNPDVKGGAIGAGHSVTAIYALVLRPGLRPADRLATVSLRWTDPGTNRAVEIAQDVNRDDLAPSFRSTSANFKLDAIVAATAEVLRGSPWIEGYRVRDVRSVAVELAGELPQTAEARDFLQLLDQASRLGS